MNRFTCTRAFYISEISQISWFPLHPSLTRRRFDRSWCPPGVLVQHSICRDNQLASCQKVSEWARRSYISSALWRSTSLPHNLWATINSIFVGMSVYVVIHIPEQLIMRPESPKINKNSFPKIRTSPSPTFALKTITPHVEEIWRSLSYVNNLFTNDWNEWNLTLKNYTPLRSLIIELSLSR